MPISKVFHVKSEAGLNDVAAELAPLLKNGTVVALEGDLGAGKTAFARALIRIRSGKPALDVPSPTFTLLQTYDTPQGSIWHFDLYRLKHPEEVYELGWEEALSDNGITLVEWPERIATMLPRYVMRVTITPEADGTRTLKVTL